MTHTFDETSPTEIEPLILQLRVSTMRAKRSEQHARRIRTGSAIITLVSMIVFMITLVTVRQASADLDRQLSQNGTDVAAASYNLTQIAQEATRVAPTPVLSIQFAQSMLSDAAERISVSRAAEAILLQGDIDYFTQITALTSLISSHPKDGMLYLLRAHVHEREGAYQEAGNDYEAALSLGQTAACLERVRIYELLAQADTALIYHRCGDLYLSQRDNEQALSAYENALRLDPSRYAAYTARGGIYLERGEYDRALADFNQSLSLAPSTLSAANLIPIYHARGQTYFMKSDYPNAIIDFSRVIELSPNDMGAYSWRANAKYRLRDYDAAAADYAIIVERNPSDADARKTGADALNRGAYEAFYKDDLDQALADVTKAITLKPDDPNLYDSRCEFYLSSEQWALGLADCDKATSLGWTFSAKMTALIETAHAHLDGTTR